MRGPILEDLWQPRGLRESLVATLEPTRAVFGLGFREGKKTVDWQLATYIYLENTPDVQQPYKLEAQKGSSFWGSIEDCWELKALSDVFAQHKEGVSRDLTRCEELLTAFMGSLFVCAA